MDAQLFYEGSMLGILPLSQEASDWIDDNVETEGWQWMGSVLWIDHRYGYDLVYAMEQEGFDFEA